MSTERFNSIVENIKKENKIESDERWQAALKQENMTMADLRRQLERTMLVQQVQQTGDHGEAAGHRHRAQDLLRSAQGRIRHGAEHHAARDHHQRAGRRAQGINVAQDDAAKAKAEEVRAKIVAGEPFARLASDYSDSGSKANGGLVGPLAEDRSLRRTAEGDRRPQDRRRDAGAAHLARLPDHQDRERSRTRRRDRSRTRAATSPTRSPTASARASIKKFIDQAARRSDHRLEERRSEEGLRSRPEAAGRRRDGRRNPTDGSRTGSQSGRARVTKRSSATS